jgi:hypothetical protein
LDLPDLLQDRLQKFNSQKGSDQPKKPLHDPPNPPLIKGGEGELLMSNANTISKKVKEKNPLNKKGLSQTGQALYTSYGSFHYFQ